MKNQEDCGKVDGFELRPCEDIKGIVALGTGPKSFGTFQK